MECGDVVVGWVGCCEDLLDCGFVGVGVDVDVCLLVGLMVGCLALCGLAWCCCCCCCGCCCCADVWEEFDEVYCGFSCWFGLVVADGDGCEGAECDQRDAAHEGGEFC